jgi:SAM-dependent methyltransferase
MVESLAGAGFNARGIEPSERSAAVAADSGLPVTRARLEGHREEGLDAAVAWHVLEHVDDPAGAMTQIRSWLRPGGLLLVGVPNLHSLQARIAGDDWLAFDAPRHRTHFTAGGIQTLLQRTGFTVERVRHMVWEQNPAVMWLALLSRLGLSPGYAFHLMKRNVPPNRRDTGLLLFAGLPLAPVAVALEAGAAAARRGGTVAVLARAA